MRIGEDLVLWKFLKADFCKICGQMGFFFTPYRNQGKNDLPKSWFFPQNLIFSFFCDKHKNSKFDVDTVSQVIILHLFTLYS